MREGIAPFGRAWVWSHHSSEFECSGEQFWLEAPGHSLYGLIIPVGLIGVCRHCEYGAMVAKNSSELRAFAVAYGYLIWIPI